MLCCVTVKSVSGFSSRGNLVATFKSVVLGKSVSSVTVKTECGVDIQQANQYVVMRNQQLICRTCSQHLAGNAATR